MTSAGPEHVTVGEARLRVVRVPPGSGPEALGRLLGAAGIAMPSPVVVLVGGADRMDQAAGAVCERLFSAALVPVLEQLGACLVDGGTHAGVMALAGEVRRRAGATGPHLGVVAEGTVRWPGQPAPDDGQRADLEPNHTHVVVVPGRRWGDEAPWLSAVATAVAAGRPSVTVLANGGPVAYEDVRWSLAAGRPILVLGGTGRAADRIAARTPRGAPDTPDASDDPDAADIARSPLVHVVPPDATTLAAALHAVLG